MSLPSATLRKLAALGLSSDQMAGVLDILADGIEAEESRKAAQRERTRRARDKQRGNVTVASQTHDGNSDDTRGGVTRVEDKSQTTDTTSVKKNTHAADLAAFKAALSGGCDVERIDAFVKLRRTKRGQLTRHAADLFVADATACGLSVPAAIDTCISRNWITVKADWLAKPQARAGPAVIPMKDTAANAARRRIEAIENDERQTAAHDHQQAPGVLSLDFRRAGG